ncbi:hypothetical protein H5410_004757 [Solanum commersonii]|uniref:Uncharacterized protein n=1 Tax=Solanum commersonii TaxID=4109 RepID=A0A9J6A5G7_SOLCO|nr:hypothetical protein H5410_004757 [Solanum commersonii]
MARYLDSFCYTTTGYKYMMHYEMIFSATGSTKFQNFYPANTREVYNFSKIIIKKVITPEEWGMSPLEEKDYIHPEQKVVVKYWDYVDGFNKALLYENANKNHSWFIKICSNILTQPIPNWFCKWWTLYDPSIKILPKQYKSLYAEWIDISPKLINMEQDNIFFEGMSVMYFFTEFSIPWILKWNVEFWSKLINKDLDGKVHGQEILDLINDTINKYHVQEISQPQEDTLSPFKQIARKLHMKKGIISRSEAIALYMEEVKKDLIRNLDIDIGDDISMTSATHTNQDDEACMAGEAQSYHSAKKVDIDDLFKKFQEQVEESSEKATCKGKGKA